jgi:signal transduction histidine kinase
MNESPAVGGSGAFMVQASLATMPFGTANRALMRTAGLAARNIRVTVLLCFILICGSFDAAASFAARNQPLPLQLFLIAGPAFAGAFLAVVFVREFEKRERAMRTVRALRATPPGDARLLIRLAEAERRAIEVERSKSEFVAHMSHELRTPLNAIIGFSEVIEQGFFGPTGHPKYVEYAHDIAGAGRELHGKIGDVLEFANVSAGRYPIVPAAIDIGAIADNCVAEMSGRAFSRRIALSAASITSARALADPGAVRRVLTNLLSNALLYTPEGGAVRVEVRDEEGAVVASVRDTGLGFTADEIARAGGAFVRFDRPGSVTGNGLGLAVAMALARRMGGAVRIAGTPGRGTVAELRLRKA